MESYPFLLGLYFGAWNLSEFMIPAYCSPSGVGRIGHKDRIGDYYWGILKNFLYFLEFSRIQKQIGIELATLCDVVELSYPLKENIRLRFEETEKLERFQKQIEELKKLEK